MRNDTSKDLRHDDLLDYRDLFAKLERDVAAFAEAPGGDSHFNATVTAWCLADWILADLARDVAPEGMEDDLLCLTGRRKHRDKIGKDYGAMYEEMRICRDVAEGLKHAVLNRGDIRTERVVATDGRYGKALFGFSRYGDPTVRYAIRVEGKSVDALDVLNAVMERYREFLTRQALITGPSEVDGSQT